MAGGANPPGHPGQRIAQRLIQIGVRRAARAAGSSRVYWQTQSTNAAGRALYDKVATRAGFIIYAQEL